MDLRRVIGSELGNFPDQHRAILTWQANLYHAVKRASIRIDRAQMSPCPRSAALRRLLRPWRALHRRQRFQIFRDRRAVLGRELRGVLDHAPHRAARGIAVRHLPGLQEIGDVLDAPLIQPLLRDVGYPALAFRIRSAGKTLRIDNAAEDIARAVTLRAMAETV